MCTEPQQCGLDPTQQPTEKGKVQIGRHRHHVDRLHIRRFWSVRAPHGICWKPDPPTRTGSVGQDRSLTSREGRDGRPARSAVDDSEGVEVREVVTVRRTLERNQGSRIDYRRVRDPPHSGAARPQENNPAAVAARNRTLHAQAVGQRLDSGTGGPNTERSASRGKLVDGPGPYGCEGSDTDVVARVRDAVSRPVVECNARPRGTTLRVTQSWLARPCPHPFVTACEGRSPQAPAPRRRGRSEP